MRTDAPRTTCRICERAALVEMLDLGEQPLANSFLRGDQLSGPEPRYPLVLCRCDACGHAQLSITVSPEVMFRDYPYVSGTSETIPAHFAEYAAEIARRFLPDRNALVVEIGSNDGTLLRAFDRERVRTLGVEPARNIAAIARAAGIDTLNEFFGEEAARDIAASHGLAHAIVANNVVAHIDDLNGLARAAQQLLGPQGVLIAEFPYLVDMLDNVEYDTIYHEHLSYFSVRSASTLFERAGLVLFDVRRQSVHGGSIRVFVGRDRAPTAAVAEHLALERAGGYATARPFEVFAERVRRQRELLRALLQRYRAEGQRLAGYGAAAKGNTLLNYCAVGGSVLEYIADRSPLKQGLYTPGMHIPVRGTDAIATARPDALLLLAWNFATEIARQQAAYLKGGGRLIVPIPEPRVVA